MKRSLLASSLILSAIAFSCGNGAADSNNTPSEANEETATTPTACSFSVESETPEVLWVAYKYTEKTGVKGQFEEVSVSNTGSGSVEDVLKGASITINTASSNSGDPTRDPKIKDSFFGGLTDGEVITGVISAVNGSDESGSVTADITMNGISHPVQGSYTNENDKLEMKFELNVTSWSAETALNALNEVCEDLHKGADGKSILWPDVTVFVSTALASDCN